MAERAECEVDDCFEYAVAFPKKDGKRHFFCFEHYHIFGRKMAQMECEKMGLDTPEKQKAWCRKKIKEFFTRSIRRPK